LSHLLLCCVVLCCVVLCCVVEDAMERWRACRAASGQGQNE
jgi:hypothetical protein